MRGIVSFGPTWEGPFVISQVSNSSAYVLETLEGIELAHPWYGEHLKKYYQ